MHFPENPASLDALRASFVWDIPHICNIGVTCSDRVAARTPDNPAIIDWSSGAPAVTSFGELAERSNRFANALTALGVKRGTRVAIMLPQSVEAVIAHLAIYKCGAVAVPLAMQFGAPAMAFRFEKAGAQIFICEASGTERLPEALTADTPLRAIVSVSPAPPQIETIAVHQFATIEAAASASFTPVATAPDDPAMMLFTSGTTGQPKAAVHGHRVLAGHIPGIRMSQDFMPKPGDMFWTPSDWAWAGGLLNALLPALSLGVPVVAARAPKFEPFRAADLIGKAGIRNVFMPATALRLMLAAGVTRADGLANLRSLGSAGESLGAATLAKARDALGITVNEFYGQTECNAVLASCHALGINRPGSMGKPVPGHEVAILSADGSRCAPGETGEVAIKAPDPVMFLRYHDDEAATAEKFRDGWMLTGDEAHRDEEGYVFFKGRNDDVITSAGYRIGPVEIEDTLVSHPAVRLAAVVGKPDPIRSEIVKAYVVLNDGETGTDTLKAALTDHVRTQLSAFQYPREIAFVDDIPLTESGKIIRRHFREAAAAEAEVVSPS